jgi:predicted PurR-regulated permease PerM
VTAATRPKPARLVIGLLIAAVAAVLTAVLMWGLRTLIVPAFVGGLLAYICRPLVARLERYWMPRGLAVGLLLLALGLLALVTVNSVRAVMPSEVGLLELRVRALYALNLHYQRVMGLDPSWTRGNQIYRVLQRDLDPLMDEVRDVLALTSDERAQLVAARTPASTGAAVRPDRLLEYEDANARVLELRGRQTPRAEPASSTRGVAAAEAAAAPASTGQGGLAHLLSAWIVAPLVFPFLLWDTGRLKRGIMSVVPNRLFEPTLAVLADVDHALGNYVRGIFLECCALGSTVTALMALIGVPLPWAIAIGIFTGATNVVPYMGFAAALLSGLAYALLAEDVHPLLPFVTRDTFVIWVVIAVGLAELLKNVLYEPIVLGGAVSLHPLVIVGGVVGGATLFGPAGMFLAIPTITIVSVFVASSARHLKAYGLI